MKLNELYPLLTTNHFNFVVCDRNEKEPLLETNDVHYHLLKKYANMEVIRIGTQTEISKESPITNSVSVRPILSIWVLYEE